MASKYTYDRYTVAIPGDLSDMLEVLAKQAITEARERARLYCTPATWTARRVAGAVGDHEVIFRVTRKRFRRTA